MKIGRNRVSVGELRVQAGDRQFRIRARRKGRSDVWLAHCDERPEAATAVDVKSPHWFPLELEAQGREPSECLEAACRELVALLERQR